MPWQRLQQACLRDCIHVTIECESVCSDSPSGAPGIEVMTGRELGRRPGAGGGLGWGGGCVCVEGGVG